MSITTILFINLALACMLMSSVWVISLFRRDASVIDPFWGVGFCVLAISSFFLGPASGSLPTLMLVLVLVWGLRLSLYLGYRYIHEGEDRRYKAMRNRHPDTFWLRSLVTVFNLQAVVLWVVSLPIQVAIVQGAESTVGVAAIAGVILWSIGLFFETVGDWQLMKFKSNPVNQKRVLRQGLWKYTRHPNYFGDFCVMWGFFLISISAGGIWTVFAPAIMSFFLLRVSGVTLLEKSISKRRPEYEEYVQSTSSFLPWFPKQSTNS